MPRFGHDHRLLVDAAGDQHQPLRGARHDAVVGGERCGRARSACTTAATSRAGAVVGAVSSRPSACSRATDSASRGRPELRSAGGQGMDPGKRLQRGGRSTGTSASSSAETRSASAATSSPAPSRTSASDEADPSSTARAWAPRAATRRSARATYAATPGPGASRRSRPAPLRTPTARPPGAAAAPADPRRRACGESAGLGIVPDVWPFECRQKGPKRQGLPPPRQPRLTNGGCQLG